MKTAVYYELQTGMASEASSGPDDIAFPEPGDGYGILVLEGTVSIPGYVKDGIYVEQPEKPGFGYTWRAAPDFCWVPDASALAGDVVALKVAAFSHVDNAAGRARLRYITSVPGQAETYTRKEQQAREWQASGFLGPAPSFIAAEAEAIGRTPQAIAEEVINLADQWANVTGPAIEATRRKWKVAAGAATTIEQIGAITEAAIAELDAL